MRATIGRLGIAVAIAALVAGCGSDKTPELMNLRKTGQGPDEFSILPTKSLQMPENLAALPVPTPGGTNITDPTPAADAIAALGGKPQQITGKLPAADSALLARADRFGADPAIRQTLAAEDLTWRQHHNGRLLERLMRNSVYASAYEPMSLDQRAELERWRSAGVPTPGAPPSSVAQKALPRSN
ncbi:DUF3035 domain-containing protein [Paenirhodobacter enshiensis]|uniref:DUF3035 domain-containing protein n=1 Tax=Paenirhodobacter enshiensis TaxID=1105367 RepID=UPI0035AD9880